MFLLSYTFIVQNMSYNIIGVMKYVGT